MHKCIILTIKPCPPPLTCPVKIKISIQIDTLTAPDTAPRRGNALLRRAVLTPQANLNLKFLYKLWQIFIPPVALVSFGSTQIRLDLRTE